MTVAIISLLAYLIPFFCDMWKAGSPERSKEAADEKRQQGRQDIADGVTGALSVRIDSVCNQAPGNSPGLGNDQDTERRLAQITGNAGLGAQ